MPSLIPVGDLRSGMNFIWANAETRRYMSTGSYPERMEVLIAMDVMDDEIHFNWHSPRGRTSDWLFFDSSCYAIHLNNPRGDWPEGHCNECGGPMRGHSYAPSKGLYLCDGLDHDDGLCVFHPECEPDFFGEMGL